MKTVNPVGISEMMI